MNRKERRRAKAKVKSVDIRLTDIPNMADAVFLGRDEGWVTVAANAKGDDASSRFSPTLLSRGVIAVI